MSSHQTFVPNNSIAGTCREGWSATLDGEGTLWYHASISAEHSSESNKSSSLLATADRAAPEMATSLALLLSTKTKTGFPCHLCFHRRMAQISATSSASKIIVSFDPSPNKALNHFGKQAEKAASKRPAGFKRTPPTPQGHSLDSRIARRIGVDMPGQALFNSHRAGGALLQHGRKPDEGSPALRRNARAEGVIGMV